MKKSRIASLVLAIAMLLSIAGCSKTEETPEVKTLAEELGFGYVSTYSSFPVELTYVNRLLYSNGRLIVYGENYNETTYESSWVLFSMLPDCTDVKMLEMPDIGGGYVNNMSVDADGNIWMQTYEYIYESGDGSEFPLPEAIEEPAPGIARADEVAEDDIAAEPAAEDESDADQTDGDEAEPTEEPVSASVSQEKINLAIAAGDYAYASEYYNENYTTREEYKLLKLDPDGNLLLDYDLSSLATGNYFYINSMSISGGYFYLIYYADDVNQIGVFDSDFNHLFSVKAETNGGDNYFYPESLIPYNGEMYVQGWGSNGNEYKPINIQTKSLGESISPSSGPVNYYGTYVGADGSLYSSDGLVFGPYDIMTGVITPLLNWIDCDINSNQTNNIIALSNEEIVVDSYDYTLETRQLIRLTQVPVSEIPKSTNITYACTWLGYEIKNAIISFNRTNGAYRIIVKDYSQYSTNDDWQGGYTKLNNDIIAGDIPDIISLDSLNVKSYTSKGLLADLYPFIDSDPDIGREYFTDGVLNAMEQDGKLYQIGLSFYIQTLAGLNSVVGDTPGWTMEQMMAAYKTLPEGAQLLQWMTKESFISNFLNYCLDDYVNYETGKCNFTSDDFIRMLELANTFPENYDDYYDEDYEYLSDSRRMKNGDLMLTRIYISGMSDYKWNMAEYTGTDLTFIGYPRSSGVGHNAYLNTPLAVSAKSKYQDGAWQFLKFLIGEEYQSTLTWQFPMSQSAYDELAKTAMEPSYYIDEKGEKVEYEDTYWIDDEEVSLPPMTQENVDTVSNLIKSIDSFTSYQYDETMMTIISEETAAYFAGTKSAQDVANLIQNRVSTYIMESM